MTYGAARGMKDFIMITLGTGVGSGIVINGQLVYGHDGFAGELGHVVVRRDAVELVEAVYEGVPSVGIQMNSLDRIYFCRENERMAKFRRFTGAPNIVGDYRTLDMPVAKVVFGDDDEDKILRVAEVLRDHPRTAEFDYIRSERTLYEILPKGSSKGNLLPRLAEILGVKMSRTVAIGDYNNDVSMIRMAGVGIAVANATEEAKAAADIITVSNEESAIAKVIGMIDDGEIRFEK
jgi:hydroxymethylpyrimidine pyrophosphatase-like HAD family hydrolase